MLLLLLLYLIQGMKIGFQALGRESSRRDKIDFQIHKLKMKQDGTP